MPDCGTHLTLGANFVLTAITALSKWPGNAGIGAAVNAEGVASHSPGLTAAFCGQPWDECTLYHNPERVASGHNPFRVVMVFAELKMNPRATCTHSVTCG